MPVRDKKTLKRVINTMMVLICIIFIVPVFVMGCGDTDEKEVSATEEAYDGQLEKAVAVSNDDLGDDSTALSVGNTAVPYREYKVYYYLMENQYNTIIGSEVWTKLATEEKTIGQEAVEDVLRLIIQVKVICKEAKEQGVELAADEREDAQYHAEQFFESLSELDRTETGATTAVITRIFEENKLAKKMYNIVISDVNKDMSIDDGKAYEAELIFKPKTDDPEAVRADMIALRRKVASSSKSFYLLARDLTDNADIEEIVGPLDERKNLYKTVASLKPGQISAVIEENDGFYIACLIGKSSKKINEKYRQRIAEKRQIEGFQKAYSEWSEHYEVVVSDALLSK